MCQCGLSVLTLGLADVRMTAEQNFSRRSRCFTGAKNPCGRALGVLKLLTAPGGVNLLNVCFDILIAL